ncbi:MAG: hypothetical protein HC877_23040 [Thioploca sp.]|nr:hypothetical protein [Thioploca sp.]
MSKYISNWLVLGPIFDESHQTSESQHHKGDGHPKAGEIIRDIDNNSIDPEAITRSFDNAPQDGDVVIYGNGSIYAKQEYTWRSRELSDIDWNNIHDVEDNIHRKLPLLEQTSHLTCSAFLGKHHALAFFLVHIESPKDRKTKLCIRSDDSIRVWLNGNEIEDLKWEDERDINKYSTEVCSNVNLLVGCNILMIAVAETHYEWGFSARIEHDTDLRFTTIPSPYLKVTPHTAQRGELITIEGMGWGNCPIRLKIGDSNVGIDRIIQGVSAATGIKPDAKGNFKLLATTSELQPNNYEVVGTSTYPNSKYSASDTIKIIECSQIELSGQEKTLVNYTLNSLSVSNPDSTIPAIVKNC